MPTILMIDDDAEFSGLVAVHFTGLGYKMLLSHEGEEGLKTALANKPDIIFLDIVMPGMSGIEVLRELQALDGTSDIPVIIMTGNYFDKGMSELFAQERNCREFISKPVSLAQLQKKVETILKCGGK
ncbi:MAG: response regulator [Elusimicrobia bacterium]|nr:response regulator [Elusimicrobiota bacterium]